MSIAILKRAGMSAGLGRDIGPATLTLVLGVWLWAGYNQEADSQCENWLKSRFQSGCYLTAIIALETAAESLGNPRHFEPGY